MFDDFKKELIAHHDGGFHHVFGVLENDYINTWLQAHALEAPAPYIDFLCQVGPGVFFGGALTIYPLTRGSFRSVESELLRIREVTSEAIVPFGYDGTTESCYCFESQNSDSAVYWFSWKEKIRRPLSPKFEEWIEAKPSQLFTEQMYAGYKKLSNVDDIVAVMDERSAFSVRLIRFDKQLQRLPDKPNDLLPRYNRVVLEIAKMRAVKIPVLTVLVERVGSKFGASNVEYVTFPVTDIPINVPTIRECYVFDPFNVPFKDVVVKLNPIIDLGSKMRVKFKEISDLLKK